MFAAPAWNPHLIKHAKKEQKYAMRLVTEVRGMRNGEKLQELNLMTL